MTMLKRRRVLAAKIEATPGTAVGLSNADAAFNAVNPSIKPSFEFHRREAQGGFGDLEGVTGSKSGTATFSIELSGGAQLPDWATTFLPACGWVANAGVFSPKSAPPGADVKTLTIGCYEDGKLKMIRGASGTFKIMLETGKRAMIDFTFTGVWVSEADEELLTPDYPAGRGMRFLDSVINIGGWNPKVAKVDFDAGNTVELREDAGDPSGYCNAIVSDRTVVGSFDPESTTVADQPIYDEFENGITKAISVKLKDLSNNEQIVIDAPKAQYSDVQPGSRGNRSTDDIKFQCCRNSSGGDDELTITFSEIT